MMDAAVTVDVVVPVYNNAAYIGAALDSILEQRPGVRRIFVVDDGSTDGSADIAASRSRVEVMRQPNRGPGAARNRGIERATAEFIAFLDADDLWLPGKLACQLAAFERDPTLDLVFGGMDYFYSPDLAPADYPHKPPPQAQAYLVGAMLARRSCFERAGLLPEGLVLGEFIAWYDRARAAGLREAIVPQTVLHRRLHANNFTRRQADHRSDYLKVVRSRLRERRGQGEPGDESP